MASHLRIPGVVDLLQADAPEEVRLLAGDARLDRRFEKRGPLANRLLAGRVRDVLQVGGRPLPSVAAREAPGRAAQQAEVEARLAQRLDPPCSAEHLEELAQHVLGRRDAAALGPLVQEVTGRLFAPDYRGSAENWAAAVLLDQAVRSFNPFRRLAWFVTGRIGKARRLLAGQVQGNLAGLHATGVAVHTLLRAFERMRDLARPEAGTRGMATADIVSRSLAAPERVLRQATGYGATAAGTFGPGTIVVLGLEAARAHTLDADLAFMSDNWARCPAGAWVPALLAAVWDRVRSEPDQGSPAP